MHECVYVSKYLCDKHDDVVGCYFWLYVCIFVSECVCMCVINIS